jgi:glycopeptide antibiotics resistance protein
MAIYPHQKANKTLSNKKHFAVLSTLLHLYYIVILIQILLLFVFLDHGLFAHFKDGVLCSFRIVFVINAHLYINILDFKLTNEQGSGII